MDMPKNLHNVKNDDGIVSVCKNCGKHYNFDRYGVCYACMNCDEYEKKIGGKNPSDPDQAGIHEAGKDFCTE